jgi:glyoxylate/hydroxypyruvate reductase A
MTILLLIVPPAWGNLTKAPLLQIGPEFDVRLHGGETYLPDEIEYAVTFRPPHGLLKSLSNLKIVFSLGAGVDGILDDADYPTSVPLVRFVDRTLSREMSQYCVLHVLMHYRMQRCFDHAQAERQWRQTMLPKRTEDTGVGILGLGEIGTATAERLRDLGFRVSGWSRTRRRVAGVESFAGNAELPAFLARSDFLICLLPLTPETGGILDTQLFAQLPKGAFIINAARGGHVVEADLVAALDSGHLGGATLDVFAVEPLPEDSPLWPHPKITVTPHIAAISEAPVAARYIVERIRRFERGEPLENVVDPRRGY